MTDIQRIRLFKPDYLLKEGYNHYMVKGNKKVYIHKHTFDIARKTYSVRKGN